MRLNTPLNKNASIVDIPWRDEIGRLADYELNRKSEYVYVESQNARLLLKAYSSTISSV